LAGSFIGGDFMQLRENFALREFLCRCGRCEWSKESGGLEVLPKLLDVCQRVRDAEETGLKITSGARCLYHNQQTPGAVGSSSWHIPRKGILHAVDITFSETSLRTPLNVSRLYIRFDQEKANGLGLYHGRIHVDFRPGPRGRWTDPSWSWLNHSLATS
jgi:hypothetical protein